MTVKRAAPAAAKTHCPEVKGVARWRDLHEDAAEGATCGRPERLVRMGAGNGNMKIPFHLWIVGILALIWNGLVAFDFLMTNARNENYLKALPPEQLSYLDNMPTWANLFWAVAVFAALAGSLLLLLRSRFASLAFAFSLLGNFVTFFYGLFLSPQSILEIGGGVALIFTVSLVLVTLFFWAYSRRMAHIGILN